MTLSAKPLQASILGAASIFNNKLEAVIVTSGQATARTSQAASDMAAKLSVMLSRSVNETTSVDGQSGIAIGRPFEFTATAGYTLNSPEEYIIQQHANGYWLLGDTDAAIESAVWDFLHICGYRQFFPGTDWEHIPQRSALPLVSVRRSPRARTRHMFFSYGQWADNQAQYNDWKLKNRWHKDTFILNTSHVYQTIMADYPAEFAANPDWIFEGTEKFRCLNPGLQAQVITWAQQYLTDNPDDDSVSVEPSDGGGWGDEGGLSVSDRVLTLANKVAEAIPADKYAAFYAYNFHSPPPETIMAHARVIALIATAYVKDGLTADELFDGWRAAGIQRFGMREYYAVVLQDRDLPSWSRGSDLAYVEDTLNRYGAEFVSIEASDCWALCGLGHYIAGRLMWQEEPVQALVDDFYTKLFPGSMVHARRFFDTLDKRAYPLMSAHLLGDLYDALTLAHAAALSDGERSRIDSLTQYVRYLELHRAYENDDTTRQTSFETLMRYAYRINKTHMVHARGIWRTAERMDPLIEFPPGTEHTVPESTNPWKDSTPYPASEIATMRADGVAANPSRGFDLVLYDYQSSLAPYGDPAMDAVFDGRRFRRFWVWIEPGEDLQIKVTAGYIYGDRGSPKIRLYHQGVMVDEDLSIPPDKVERETILTTPHAGLHELTVEDGSDRTKLIFVGERYAVLEHAMDAVYIPHARYNGNIYVPEGVTTLGFYAEGPGQIRNPAGDTVLDRPKDIANDYVSVPATPGVWRLHQLGNLWRLCTTPPLIGEGLLVAP